MLRKKLKLADNIAPEPVLGGGCLADFSLSAFASEQKPKLSFIVPLSPNPPSSHCAGPDVAPDGEEPIIEPLLAPLWQRVYQLELQLCNALKQIPLPSDVAATYDPIEYASELHLAYMKRFLDKPKPVLFLGMNPGPWGMCQTGVPFGYVPAIRDWMQLTGQVNKPAEELAVRPIEGLNCARAEQSGQRWWGLYKELCGTPEQFFHNCFVFNLCPLAFFHSSGRNITPADFKGPAKNRLQEVCAEYLKTALDIFDPAVVVSVGRYTEDRVKTLVKQKLLDENRVQLKCMPHPSPRSLNNNNWNEKAKVWLEQNGIMPYLIS